MTTLSHRIRLEPTAQQREGLAKAAGCARFAWNWALQSWKDKKAQGSEKISMNDLKKEFNRIKRENFPWIYDSPKGANQQPFSNLKKAFTRYYEGKKRGQTRGFPKPKKKGKCQDSFYLSNDQFKLETSVVNLPLMGQVRLSEPLRFEGKILSATVSRTAGDWYISFSIELPEPFNRFSEAQETEKVLGLDFSMGSLIVSSDNERLTPPLPLKRYLKRLQRLSRQHSRKKRGSSNRAKAAERLARLHQRVTNIRQDFLHKVSTQLLRENQTIVVETLTLKAFQKRWGRKVSDLAFGELVRQLEYKAPLFGRTFIKADRFFPSTKLCSSCGAKKDTIALNERTYVCEHCGVTIDRDLNAALNLKNIGVKNLTQLGAVSAEVTPVEISALALPLGNVKLRSTKQELSGEHPCSLER